MSMSRVLVIGINYKPEQTGIAVHTTALAEGLAGRGWDVTVLTGIPHYPAWRPGPIPPLMPDYPVQVLRRSHFVPPRQSLPLRAWFEASWVASCLPLVLQRRPVDVILGVTPNLGGGVLAAVGARRLGVPFVVMFQDLLGRAARQTRIRHARWVSGAVEAAELGLARRAAGVAVIAEGFRCYLTERGVSSQRIHCVRNPVRTQRSRKSREQARQQVGWPNDEFIVLHSGNMGIKQGLENVLRAARLCDPNARIRFLLQGDGSQRARLEELARDLGVPNVTFLPLASTEDLPDMLAAADILLLNQLGEVRDMSLPTKLAGYLAAGVPVVAAVASDSETGREVERSGAGVLVEPDKPEALLQAVLDLASDEDRRRKLGAAGTAFADRELQPQGTLDQMEWLLERALVGGRAGADAGRTAKPLV